MDRCSKCGYELILGCEQVVFCKLCASQLLERTASGSVAGGHSTTNKLKAEIAAIADAIDGNYGDVDFVREQADKLRQLSAV